MTTPGVRRTAIVTGVCAGLLMSGASSASASEADRAAQLIEGLAPIEVVDVARDASGLLVADGDSAEVTLPTSVAGDVLLAPDEGAPITLGLPDVAARNAVVADDGTVVYGGKSVDVALQATDDGIRAQTVIADASAPTEYTYTFEGLTPVLQADGSAVLQASSKDGVVIEAGTVDVPWALDANGDAVATHYRVQGDALVQVVEHQGAAYPVVADPSVSSAGGSTSATPLRRPRP
jgi:hypothetical protein